jgi:hypothetical protein
MIGNIFGLLQLCQTRWAPPKDIIAPFFVVGSENTLGFGQMVALLLTALPMLAAGEAYYGTYRMSIHQIVGNLDTGCITDIQRPKHQTEIPGLINESSESATPDHRQMTPLASDEQLPGIWCS